MAGLVHVTKCLLCDPKHNPFQLDSPGFQVEDVANGNIPERLTKFNLELLAHIQKAARWEQDQVTAAVQRQKKNPVAIAPIQQAVDFSQAKHLNAWKQFVGHVGLIQGFRILSGFHTTDPALESMREAARFALHESTRKFVFTDQMLEDAVVQLQLDVADQANVLAFAKAMRDALLEQGQYAPKQEQPTGIVV